MLQPTSKAGFAPGGTWLREDEPVLMMTDEDFDRLVVEALDGVPESLLGVTDNLVVLVEDESSLAGEPDLLGLYEGTPLTERDVAYSGVLPDRITIYRGPVLRMCSSFQI
jgi:predicted Zn-dependent protease with MMP-like domain